MRIVRLILLQRICGLESETESETEGKTEGETESEHYYQLDRHRRPIRAYQRRQRHVHNNITDD